MAYRSSGNLAYDLNTYPDLAPRAARTSGAARAYSAASASVAPRVARDPEVRAIRTAHNGQEAQQQPLLKTAAIMLAVIISVVAALSFARIMLTSVTVTTMIESDAISAQISEARTTGTSLEMEQSVLSNPSALKAQAKKLDMATPYVVNNIALTPDVVAIDSAGSLSLSDTIKNVVANQK